MDVIVIINRRQQHIESRRKSRYRRWTVGFWFHPFNWMTMTRFIRFGDFVSCRSLKPQHSWHWGTVKLAFWRILKRPVGLAGFLIGFRHLTVFGGNLYPFKNVKNHKIKIEKAVSLGGLLLYVVDLYKSQHVKAMAFLQLTRFSGQLDQ